MILSCNIKSFSLSFTQDWLKSDNFYINAWFVWLLMPTYRWLTRQNISEVNTKIKLFPIDLQEINQRPINLSKDHRLLYTKGKQQNNQTNSNFYNQCTQLSLFIKMRKGEFQVILFSYYCFKWEGEKRGSVQVCMKFQLIVFNIYLFLILPPHQPSRTYPQHHSTVLLYFHFNHYIFKVFGLFIPLLKCLL
jgi:hypothetical protein